MLQDINRFHLPANTKFYRVHVRIPEELLKSSQVKHTDEALIPAAVASEFLEKFSPSPAVMANADYVSLLRRQKDQKSCLDEAIATKHKSIALSCCLRNPTHVPKKKSKKTDSESDAMKLSKRKTTNSADLAKKGQTKKRLTTSSEVSREDGETSGLQNIAEDSTQQAAIPLGDSSSSRDIVSPRDSPGESCSTSFLVKSEENLSDSVTSKTEEEQPSSPLGVPDEASPLPPVLEGRVADSPGDASSAEEADEFSGMAHGGALSEATSSTGGGEEAFQDALTEPSSDA